VASWSSLFSFILESNRITQSNRLKSSTINCRNVKTRKFDRSLRQLYVDLHWLSSASEVIRHTCAIQIRLLLLLLLLTCRNEWSLSLCRYLHHKAPRYLTDYCIPISDVASRQHLRSARRHYLPRHSLSSYGRRTFAVADPSVWNSLSDDLLDPTLSTDSFRRLLKTRLLSEY